MDRKFCTLRWRIPDRNLYPGVYDNYREKREMAFELFLKSKEDFKMLSDFRLPTFNAIRKPIPEDSYKGLKIYDLPLEEVGCGILTLAQGMADNFEMVTRDVVEELTSIIEEKGYYKKGSGLYWHIFKYFAGDLADHWYDLVMAIEYGSPVTVLLKYPERERNLFTNLVATKNKVAYSGGIHEAKIIDPEMYVFIDSEGNEITLESLMNPEFLVTAPWIWPATV